jgi:hypothetical protein
MLCESSRGGGTCRRKRRAEIGGRDLLSLPRPFPVAELIEISISTAPFSPFIMSLRYPDDMLPSDTSIEQVKSRCRSNVFNRYMDC